MENKTPNCVSNRSGEPLLSNLPTWYHPVNGNHVDVFDESTFFGELLSCISQTKKFVYLEFFTVENRGISKEILDMLKKKAAEGVKVRLILDWVGSCYLNTEKQSNGRSKNICFAESDMQEYRSDNFKIEYYRKGWLKLFPRTHQKLVIIDGKIAFMGGMNLIEGYKTGIESKNGHVFYTDKMLKIQGPILLELCNIFSGIWKEITQEVISLDVEALSCGESSIGIVTTCGHRYHPYFTEILVDLINKAHKEIIIRSPYIVLNNSLRNVITSAVQRGVKITFLAGAESDFSSFYEKCLKKMARQVRKLGAELIENPGYFHHDKCIIIDRKFLFTGSHNFDWISRRLQHELSILTNDPIIVRDFVEMASQCIKRAKEMKQLNIPLK